MANVKKVKAIELILDWNLWPRHEAKSLDSTNIKRMKLALSAGIELPPVVVSKKDYRVIDGFHRLKAVLSMYGDGAEIMAEMRDFKNDAEMFLESARLNSIHGLPLSPRDRTYVAIKAKKYKIPYPIIAQAIGMDKDSIKNLIKKRTAKTVDGRTIALPGGALSLAGSDSVTEKQEEYISGINGIKAATNAAILLNELQDGMFVMTDTLINNLRALLLRIEEILLEVDYE